MTFTELARKRYSCRSFSSRPVETEKLEILLETVRIAPSAANYQPVRVIVVQQRSLMEKLFESYNRNWFRKAPMILLFCGDHSLSWKRSFDGKDLCDLDVAIAVDHLTLAAAELGLGTCWVCAFDPKIVISVFNLPAHIEPIAMIPLGYPEDETDIDRHDSLRKRLNDIVQWDVFDTKNTK